MPVFVRTEGLTRRSIDPARVRTAGAGMLEALGLPEAELSVLLCEDRQIRRLNRRYRQIDRPTDVLAFPLLERDEIHRDRPILLGDIVISLPTARKQARKGKRTIAFEVTFLLAHGLLHLLGYDHRNRAEERRMNARTDFLVAAGQGLSTASR
ncbi:MAG: rRNA maturation RNase YbeY [Myxococcota bacterium]